MEPLAPLRFLRRTPGAVWVALFLALLPLGQVAHAAGGADYTVAGGGEGSYRSTVGGITPNPATAPIGAARTPGYYPGVHYKTDGDVKIYPPATSEGKVVTLDASLGGIDRGVAGYAASVYCVTLKAFGSFPAGTVYLADMTSSVTDRVLKWSCERRSTETYTSSEVVTCLATFPSPALADWFCGFLRNQQTTGEKVLLDGLPAFLVRYSREHFAIYPGSFQVFDAASLVPQSSIRVAPLTHASARDWTDFGRISLEGRGGWTLTVDTPRGSARLVSSAYIEGKGVDVDTPDKHLWVYVDGHRCADGAPDDYTDEQAKAFARACSGTDVPPGSKRECYTSTPSLSTPEECPAALLDYSYSAHGRWLTPLLRAIDRLGDRVVAAINNITVKVPTPIFNGDGGAPPPEPPAAFQRSRDKFEQVKTRLSEKLKAPERLTPSETCGQIKAHILGADRVVVDTCHHAVRTMAATVRTSLLALALWMIGQRTTRWLMDGTGLPRF